MTVAIFTDGAAKGNPGPGGWGAIVADDASVVELGGGERHTTNNRMELRAVIEAITHVQTYMKECISIYVDSQYVVNGATKWGSGWRKSGWKTKAKQPVSNRDLWESLLDLADSCKGRIEWHVVGGHIGVAGNERADEIADRFARREAVELYRGPRAGYSVDVADLSFNPEAREARSHARARSGQKAYSYVSLVGGRIEVHKTWKECEARVRGKRARFKKALSSDEERSIVRAFAEIET